jgi:hypothetical protein
MAVASLKRPPSVPKRTIESGPCIAAIVHVPSVFVSRMLPTMRPASSMSVANRGTACATPSDHSTPAPHGDVPPSVSTFPTTCPDSLIDTAYPHLPPA